MDWRRFFKPKTPQTPVQTPQKPSAIPMLDQARSAIPMLDQAMSSTKGVTDAFSGVSKQVNNTFRMLGTSSIPGGILGYGIGFRHGLGVGLSMRSGVGQLQSRIVEPMTKMIGLIPGLPFGRGALPIPESSKSDPSMVPTDQISSDVMMQLATKSASQITAEVMMQQATKPVDQISQGSMIQDATKAMDQISQGSRMQLATKSSTQISQDMVRSDSQTEKAISNFPQNSLLKRGGGIDQAAGLVQPENKLLQTVMKQRQIMDELVEENEKLCQILQVKDLKIPSTQLQASSSGSNIQTFPSSEVQDKVTDVSTAPSNADGTLPISRGENDGKLQISKGENDTKKEQSEKKIPTS